MTRGVYCARSLVAHIASNYSRQAASHTARGVLMISPEAVSSFRTGGFWSSPSDSPSRASHSGRTQACTSSREDAGILMYNVCPALPSEEPPRPPLDERQIQHSDQDRLKGVSIAKCFEIDMFLRKGVDSRS